MKKVEELKQVADEMLDGLQADQALKYRIYQAAEKQRNKKAPLFTPRRMAALSCACALAVGVGIYALTRTAPKTPDAPILQGRAAGDSGLVGTTAKKLMDIPSGGINVSVSNSAGAGIWAESEDGTFPLIRIDGRYYRLLTTPSTVSSSVLGAAIGQIDMYSVDPATARSSGSVSNIAQAGETVYEISGMSGAMIACRVNGELHAFQRVSFGSSARIGSETLADTLCANGVVRLEMTGAGSINDAALAQQMVNTLLSNAVYERASGAETGETLLIYLSNGMTLQMCVRDESLIACGTWACPEFFEQYAANAQ